MDKNEARNCWEFMNCDVSAREKCPAYKTNSGAECWFVAGNYVSKNLKCPRVANGIATCFDCPWFKKLNPNYGEK